MKEKRTVRLLAKAKKLLPWMTGQAALFDFVIAFTLTAVGLSCALVALALVHTPAALRHDLQTAVAAGLGAVGVLMIWGAVRLVRARNALLGWRRSGAIRGFLDP